MPLEYRNRKGHLYTVFQGVTKTGKPRYFVSKSNQSDAGVEIDVLPDGFEIWESPANSTVSVRRCKATRILAAERDLISRLVLQLTHFSVEQTVIDGDSIVVYTPDTDPMVAKDELRKIFGSYRLDDAFIARTTQFTAMLRFTLRDAERRIFSVERYCFRGAVDGWISIRNRGLLETVARQVIPTLSSEAFYELF